MEFFNLCIMIAMPIVLFRVCVCISATECQIVHVSANMLPPQTSVPIVLHFCVNDCDNFDVSRRE
jgi:hypothetical protein